MLLVERDTPKGLLVSVCDPDVVGQTFENGQASLTVEAGFYADGAVEADAETVVASLQRASVANLVGTAVVALAVEHGLVDEAEVLEFEGTRHAQFLRM
jgi:hypothetical protein